eukprot:scaffold9963_cov80-Isochrysis_galbana.AAC.2
MGEGVWEAVPLARRRAHTLAGCAGRTPTHLIQKQSENETDRLVAPAADDEVEVDLVALQ